MNIENKIDPILVGRRLEALRSALSIDKADFADASLIDRSSYSKIIQGKKLLKIEMGFIVSKKWGVTLEYIYKGDLSGLSKLDETTRKTIITSLTL